MGDLVDLSRSCHWDALVQRHKRRLEIVLMSSILTVVVVVQLYLEVVVEFPARYNTRPPGPS